MVKHVETVKEFKELTEGKKVVVDFYADWCGPCRMLAPVIEEADKNGELSLDVLKVNVDDLPEVARRYGIQSIPTLMVLDNGQIVRGSLGYINKNALVEFVNK